jgi:hypothetical protein
MKVQTFDSVEALLQQLQQTMMPIWVMSNTTPWPAHKLGKLKKKMVRLPALRPECALVCDPSTADSTDASGVCSD